MIFTPKEFAAIAAGAEQLADRIKPVTEPADSKPYVNSQNLAVYHLRAAAKIAREIGEHLTQTEPAK